MTMEPTPEQAAEWLNSAECARACNKVNNVFYEIARLAYAAGADAELEACCSWVNELDGPHSDNLRRARRPKPPSLKQQALQAFQPLSGFTVDGGKYLSKETTKLVLLALASLPDD